MLNVLYSVFLFIVTGDYSSVKVSCNARRGSSSATLNVPSVCCFMLIPLSEVALAFTDVNDGC